MPSFQDVIVSANRLEIARRYVANNLSVIPVKADGSKSPKHGGWRAYAAKLPTDIELQAWFSNEDAGIGVVAGPASGNLVVLDFENKYGRPAYSEWIVGLPEELSQIIVSLPVVRTPTGGRHIWIRLEEPEHGGKLCRYSKGATKVEVRGDGHMVLAPGCPRECHSTGETYEFESLGWLL